MRFIQGWAFFSALACSLIGPSGVPAAAKDGEWALPDMRLGVRTAPLLLLSRPDVQADLRLEPAQVAGAQNTIDELTQRAASLKGKSGSAVIADRRAIDEAQVEWLSKNLTGNQLIRLRQIELQWEGPSAMLSRPTVAEYLKLTSEQRQSLVHMVSERNARRSRGAIPKDQTAFNRTAQEVLSATQKELWGNLLGSPCRFAFSSAAPGTRDEATQQAGHSQPQK